MKYSSLIPCALLLIASTAWSNKSAKIQMTQKPAAPVDWAQPPVACAEDIIPHKINRPCPDLSKMENPTKDFPEGLSEQEISFWTQRKRPMQICRSTEVLRREAIKPGSFLPAVVQISWMQLKAAQNTQLKVNAVYEASRRHKMPVQVLVGALYQESIFSELGIAKDGSNYSCGVGQVNLVEWCRWANTAEAKYKTQIGWPAQGVNCDHLAATTIKPFYDIALRRLGNTPEYQINKSYFKDISYSQVVRSFSEAPEQVQRTRYNAAISFINNCETPTYGIAAKANELAHIYKIFIPKGMKERETYKPGEKFQRACVQKGFEGQYPLHSGWILAVGSYNAGPKAVDVMAHFKKLSREQMKSPDAFKNFTPKELVHSIYWSGDYKKSDDLIHFNLLNGSAARWGWFKLCVLQRHMSRVVSHTVQVGQQSPVESLEGEFKCAKSSFDPKTGKLLESGVPPHRRDRAL